MDKENQFVALYVKERDEATIKAVESDTLEPFKAFIEKYKLLGAYPTCFELPSDDVLEIAVRKMVIHETRAPESVKQKATEWLLSRGYDLNLD